tara:strand:+ start:55258 stop:55533 length:276 start_codon:yes stop_codon:yes gene_type:complete
MFHLIFKYSLLFSSLFIFISLFFGDSSYFDLSKKKNAIIVLNDNIKKLDSKILDVKELIDLYNNSNNLDFKSSLIKQELFMKSENEKVIFY